MYRLVISILLDWCISHFNGLLVRLMHLGFFFFFFFLGGKYWLTKEVYLFIYLLLLFYWIWIGCWARLKAQLDQPKPITYTLPWFGWWFLNLKKFVGNDNASQIILFQPGYTLKISEFFSIFFIKFLLLVLIQMDLSHIY